VGYSYDAASRRIGMTPASQAAVMYQYDNANRLLSITQGSEVVQLGYDDANRRTSLTLPNGIFVTYGYDNANQLTSLVYTQGNGTALGNLTYSYDVAGHITGQGGSLAFNQLPTPTTQSSSFDDNNRQTSFNGATLSYDANGNLTSDGVNSFVWNARNQLVQIQQGGVPQLSFAYDAVGRRISKTVGTTTPTQYLYDGNNAVQEAQGTTVNPILTGLGIDERYARNDVTGRTYFLTDLLGSTIELANGAGEVKQRYAYDPYGNVTQTDTSTGYTNPYQYTGREADTAGLYYYRARYYSPGMGRFIGEDPIGFGGGQLNFYAYVDGSPIGMRDPEGKFGIVGALIGAGIDIGMQMLIQHRSIRCVNFSSVLTSAAVGFFTPGWLRVGKALAGSMVAADAAIGWTARDLAFLQVSGAATGQIMKHAVKEKGMTIGDYCECGY
jgi:RHS repeat-associated protein